MSHAQGAANRMIVTSLTSKGQILHSEIWDTRKAFGLGFPYRWILEKTSGGFRIRDLSQLEIREISDAQAKKNILLREAATLSGPSQIRIHPILTDLNAQGSKAKTPLSVASHTAPVSFEGIENPRNFKQAMSGVSIAVLLALLLAQVIPAHKNEELIPPQFAKVIMTPPAAARAEKQAAESSRAVSVVQAFQSGTVKKSTQALLKASVASLLSKTSPFSINKSNSALQGLFSAKNSQQLGLTGVQAKPQEIASLSVGAMGGKGTAAGGVGYGTGEHAGVKGQGGGLVSLNTPDAQVDEGLTKDEVGKVIHAHISEVRYCYESAMVRNPDVQGKLMVNFVIRPVNGAPGMGIVKTAQVHSSTVADSGGVDVSVAYPFIFKSLGK
ncbi:MAG: AgmX/PglI C-terminal domain-containing protein [Bdellovibrio sp.]|nr:AgmX/PglI C-terminal domain-containing protein [Bdellovibrio sp.]